MSMHRNLAGALGASIIAGAPLAVAHEQGEGLAARQAAEVSEPLPDTGERAPEPVPVSSAETVADLDPANFVFGIGRPASPEEIAAIDIDVMLDGRGAPEGSGTYAEGEELYAATCAHCHGQELEGIAEAGAPALIGGRGTLDTDNPVRTVESYWPHASTLFDYTHRAMPFNEPGSLTDDEVYAISAYILGRAGILDQDAEMNADSFAEIEMPNVDGFIPDPRPDTPVGETPASD